MKLMKVLWNAKIDGVVTLSYLNDQLIVLCTKFVERSVSTVRLCVLLQT